jgi:hypothetical protein
VNTDISNGGDTNKMGKQLFGERYEVRERNTINTCAEIEKMLRWNLEQSEWYLH